MKLRSVLVMVVFLLSLLGTSLAPLPVAAFGETGDPYAYIAFEYSELDAFWAETMTATGFDYFSPELTVVDEPLATSCGSASPAVGGTHYCSLDATIYYALGDLQGDAYVGDFAMTFTLAHEWSHHLQQLMYGESTHDDTYTLFFELQADCLAGAYGAHLDLAGLLEAGDIQEVTAILLIIGYHGPATEQSHGTPDERVDAYFEGFDTTTCERYI